MAIKKHSTSTGLSDFEYINTERAKVCSEGVLQSL